MKSVLYVPSGKLHNVAAMLVRPGVDEVFIDLDKTLPSGVLTPEMAHWLEEIPDKGSVWIRPSLRRAFRDEVDTSLLGWLGEKGFHRFLLPKLMEHGEVQDVLHDAPEADYVLLVEHPRLLRELESILHSTPEVAGVGIGSLDFFSNLGSISSRASLEALRREVLWTSNAYGRYVVDTSCLNLTDPALVARDAFDALLAGMDEKPFIHPWQIDVLGQGVRSILEGELLEDVRKSRRVLGMVAEHVGHTLSEPVKFEGEMVEHAHVAWAKRLIHWVERWI